MGIFIYFNSHPFLTLFDRSILANGGDARGCAGAGSGGTVTLSAVLIAGNGTITAVSSLLFPFIVFAYFLFFFSLLFSSFLFLLEWRC